MHTSRATAAEDRENTSASGAVVVGYDGSRAADAALTWAAGEAETQHRRLHVIHTREPTGDPVPPEGVDTAATGPDRAAALLAQAANRVRPHFPGLELTVASLDGPASLVLLRAAAEADTVVLGAHGQRLRRLADLGSTAWQLVSHAECPVVVVRPRPSGTSRRLPIVLGVSASRSGDAARTYAFTQAHRRQVPLVAVHGWHLAPQEAAYAVLQSDRERSGEDRVRGAQLERWLRPWREKFPDVEVEIVCRMWNPAGLLLEHARRSQLVVVGRRPTLGYPGLLLESTAFDLLPYVAGPLAVVPSRHRVAPPPGKDR